MMHKCSNRTISIIVVMFLVSLLAACSAKSLQMSKDNIENAHHSDGIIFGSILVQAKEVEDDSFWQTFQKGKKATDFKYKFLVSKLDSITASHEFIVEPNNETYFVSKIDNGEYKIFKVIVVYKSNYLNTKTDIHFTVTNNITYIGKLIVSLPERMKAFEKITLKVEDDQINAEMHISEKYGIAKENIVKSLMRIEK